MESIYYELPKQIVFLLNTIGPIYEKVTDVYYFKIDAIIQSDNRIVGFLIDRRPLDKKERVSDLDGLSIPVQIKPNPGVETTFIFADTLKKALEYINRSDKPSA